MKRHQLCGFLAVVAAGSLIMGAPAGAQEPPSEDQPIKVSASQAIKELIDINANLAADNQRLAGENQRLLAENARLKLETARITKERDDLSNFIHDHETYADNYNKYTFFREKAEREEKARQAAEAKARREEEKLRQQQEREDRLRQRNSASDTGEDDALAKRVDILKRAGYTRVGDRVFVGEMGYSYKTETHEQVRYSPIIDFWYVDRDEKILYNEMTVSGSIVHAGNEERNISVALAFFDAGGAQIGTTTVRIDGAKPGTPYPFTSVVAMASNRAFKRYSSWVLFDESAVAPPPVMEQPQPTTPPTNPPTDG